MYITTGVELIAFCNSNNFPACALNFLYSENNCRICLADGNASDGHKNTKLILIAQRKLWLYNGNLVHIFFVCLIHIPAVIFNFLTDNTV